MPPPTTTTSNSSCDSAARARLRSITTSSVAKREHAHRTAAGSQGACACWAPAGPAPASDVRELCRYLRDRRLRVPEQHGGLRLVVELVFDACEPGVHRALDHDHRMTV